MGWLGKLFSVVPREERNGAHLDFDSPHWELSGKRVSFASVLNALCGLLPEDAILYFESGSPSSEITRFMTANAVPEQTHIEMGTIWPRPKVFHVPASKENLQSLANMMDHHAEPELAVHFHVYQHGTVMLQWYDAFDDPMYLSGEWPEDKVKAFSHELGWEYRSSVEPAAPPDASRR